MITIYETREAYLDEQGRARWYTMYNAQRPSGRYLRATTIDGPVKAADMGFGVWGGQLDDGLYAPRDILGFARRHERGLSIASEG